MTRDRRDIREKTRAVLLAAIMIVSVFGGTMAFAGSAAADATKIELSDTLVQGGEEITVSGEVNSNGTVNVYIADSVDNTTYNSESILNSTEISDHTEEGYEVTINAPSSSGDYQVAVIQSDTSLTDGEDDIQQSAEIQVDADEPTFGDETPEGDITSADEIVVPINDANTSVQTITATVTNSDGAINTYEINPETAAGDGVSWDGSELVIDPGAGDVPPITADGTYDVNVSATDEVGNSNSTDFSFTVDSVAPTSSFDLPDQADDQNENLTNDENETVKVSLSTDRSINDSTVSLDIDGPSYSESFDYEDDEYDNSSDEFSVTPDGDAVPSFNDGEYHVTVSAQDDIGNYHEETYGFEVDLSPVIAEGVTLSEDDLNNESADPTVTVEFDEEVDVSTVSANVRVDGETRETLSFSPTENSDEAEATLNLSDPEYDNLENDSAFVNVTSAQDPAGNGLDFDNSRTRVPFDIDTDGPTVELGTLPNGGTLSGYVNVTDFVSTREDVANTEFFIAAADDDDSVIRITENAENLNTRALLDGDHRLIVAVTDENGNTDIAEAPFTLDNSQTLVIGQKYLEGGFGAFDHEVDEESISVGDIFVEAPSDTEYEIDGEDATDEDTILAEENRGQVVNVTASSDDTGEVRTVTLDFGPLVGVESVEGHTIDIGVESSEELSELNVTLETDDNYVDQSSEEYTISHFDEHETPSGYVYSLTEGDLRDGDYTVTVTDAEDADGDNDASVGLNGDTDATVDHHDPSANTAYVIGSNGDATAVQVKFSEVVNDVDAADISFDGSSDAVRSVDNNGDGTLSVVLNGEVQTADAPLLNVSGVTETSVPEGEAADTADTSTEVATASYDLSADGLNVISIPAETGRVDISETAFNSDAINITVSAYDADTGEWEQFSSNADDNELTHLEGGVGYVVNVEEDTTVEINAENAPVANDRTQQSVEAGWNLVGHYQEGQQQVGQALTPLGDQVYQIEEGYTGTQLTNDAALNPEQGYWLFTNEGGLHVPVNYGGPTSEKPDVFVPSGVDFVDSEPTNGGSVKLTVAVDTDAAVQTVRADAPDLDIEGAELNTRNAPEVQGATAYTGTFDVDYQPDYDGIDNETITVSAITADGNIGSNSVDVDPVNRSGSVSITDADFSDLTEGDTANVTVDVSYNAGGFENATLSVKNSTSGVEAGLVDLTAEGEVDQSVDVPVELSELDNQGDVTAELIDAGEASDYVVADDTTSVSGLQDLAYVENSPSTILGTGATAIQDAENKNPSSPIFVESGTYDGFTADATVTVESAPGADPLIGGDSASGTQVIVDGVDLTLTQVDIRVGSSISTSSSGDQGVSVRNGGSVDINGGTISNAYGAVQSLSADNTQVRVDGLTVEDSVFGVGLQSNANDVVKNSVINVTDQGVSAASNTLIDNNDINVEGGANVFTDNTRGIDTDDSNVTVTGSNSIASTDYGIIIGDAAGPDAGIQIEDGITFDVADAEVDDRRAGPSVTGLSKIDGDTVELTFDEGVYAKSDSTGDLTAQDFEFTDSSNDGVSVNNVTHTAGDNTVTINLTGTPSDGDSVTITSPYYDQFGNQANQNGDETVTLQIS